MTRISFRLGAAVGLALFGLSMTHLQAAEVYSAVEPEAESTATVNPQPLRSKISIAPLLGIELPANDTPTRVAYGLTITDRLTESFSAGLYFMTAAATTTARANTFGHSASSGTVALNTRSYFYGLDLSYQTRDASPWAVGALLGHFIETYNYKESGSGGSGSAGSFSFGPKAEWRVWRAQSLTATLRADLLFVGAPAPGVRRDPIGHLMASISF